MSNNILTASIITREAIRLWRNSNSFIQAVDTQYDDQFARTGAKIGTTLRIRLPNDYVVSDGPAASIQDTNEQQITLVVATQRHVDVGFSSLDRTMKLQDFSKRNLEPMINNLVGNVALTVMSGVEAGACNYEATVDGSSNITHPTARAWLRAGARLDAMSAPRGTRRIILDPFSQAESVNTLAGFFNPQPTISKQFETGEMFQALGATWSQDQTVLSHTTGAYGGTLQVSTAGQVGTTLNINGGMTGGFKAGDIFTIAGVYMVNRITKQTTAQLMQFVITADVAGGATSIPIYPAIIPAASDGSAVQYQTVNVSPGANAPITVVSKSGEIYRKNFLMHPEAVTMATADLEIPGGVHESAREQYDGVSMRMVSQYNIGTDFFLSRLDVLFGYLWVRPEWVCVVPDSA